MTIPERLLWARLRAGRCAGAKFRRQHPLGRYYVDFCCPLAWLVVELDAGSHEGRREDDEIRQQYLERIGYSVVRFLNDDVLHDLDGVVAAIARGVKSHPHRPPSAGPSP